jgi:CBS domain-containing protein
MTTGCVTVPLTATLADCVTRMLMAGTGSVLIDDTDGPVGIVTESDVLAAAKNIDEPLDDIPAHTAMSQPLQRIEPSATVRRAADRMRDLNIKKLVVAEGLDPIGIVTMTDLVWHFSDFQREAGEVATAGREWTHESG